MGDDKAADMIAAAQRAFVAVFSWIFLIAASVIISGKLLAQRIPLNAGEGDLFSINLIVFRLRAKGSEVSLGFLIFILLLGSVAVVGGGDAYRYFEVRTGLSIGQWNSLCAIAAFFSVILSLVVWSVGFAFRSPPLISPAERSDQIEALKRGMDL